LRRVRIVDVERAAVDGDDRVRHAKGPRAAVMAELEDAIRYLDAARPLVAVAVDRERARARLDEKHGAGHAARPRHVVGEVERERRRRCGRVLEHLVAHERRDGHVRARQVGRRVRRQRHAPDDSHRRHTHK